MERRTAHALEDVKHHDMLILRGDDVQRYTGSDSTVGAILALAHEDIKADQRGEIQPFFTIDPKVSAVDGEPPLEMSEHDERVFDAQVGGVWARLSSAANTLARNVRGKPTVTCELDNDDLIVRSASTWKGFGFILARDHHQIWGWARTTFLINLLPLELRVMRGQLRLIHDGSEVSEVELVNRLERDLSS